MLKRILAPLLLLLFLIVQTADAQLKFNTSPILKKTYSDEPYTILARENGGYIVLLRTTRVTTYLVKVLDSKLQLENEFPLVIDKGRGFAIQDFIMLKGKYYLVYGLETAKVGDKVFFEEFNTKTGMLSGKSIEMASSTAPLGCDQGNTVFARSTFMGLSQKTSLNKFDIIFSPDSSKLLFISTYMPKSNEDARKGRKMMLVVFDNNLKKIWSKDVDITFEKGDNAFGASFIDNVGNVYLKFSSTVDKAISQSIYRFTENGNKPDVVDLPFSKKAKAGTYTTFDKQGNLCILGGYSNENTNNRFFRQYLDLDGAYCIRIDFTAEPSKRVSESYKEISPELMQLGESKYAQKVITNKESKGNVNLKKIYFKEVIPSDDGGFYILFEQYEEVSGTRTASDGTPLSDGVYRDIYVIKVSEDGQITQIKKINKWQRTYRNSTAYFAYVANHELHFLITDNPDNINLTEDQEPKQDNDVATVAKTDGAVFDITLKSDGTIKRSIVLDFKNFKGARYFDQDYMKTANNRFVKFDYPLISGFSFNKGAKFYIIEIE